MASGHETGSSLGVYYLGGRETAVAKGKPMAGTSRETSGSSYGKEQGLVMFCGRGQDKKVLVTGVIGPVCTFPVPSSCPNYHWTQVSSHAHLWTPCLFWYCFQESGSRCPPWLSSLAPAHKPTTARETGLLVYFFISLSLSDF